MVSSIFNSEMRFGIGRSAVSVPLLLAIIIIIIYIPLIFNFLGSAVLGTNETRQLYSNSNDRYEIIYPYNWDLVEDSNNMLTIISPAENNSDPFQENVAIEVSNEGNLELNQLVGLQLIEYRQDLIDFRLISSNRYIVSDNPWYVMVYAYTEREMPLVVMQLWTSLAGKLYSIIYTAEAANYFEYLPAVQFRYRFV